MTKRYCRNLLFFKFWKSTKKISYMFSHFLAKCPSYYIHGSREHLRWRVTVVAKYSILDDCGSPWHASAFSLKFYTKRFPTDDCGSPGYVSAFNLKFYSKQFTTNTKTVTLFFYKKLRSRVMSESFFKNTQF